MATETSAQSRTIKRHTKLRRGSAGHGARQAKGVPTTSPDGTPALRETCGCGCGAEINVTAREILRLRSRGWTFKRIAAEWGRTADEIKFYFHNPVRYVVGHYRAPERVDGFCVGCGRPMRVIPGREAFALCSGRSGCRWKPSEAAEEARRNYDSREEARNAARLALRSSLLDRVHATRPIRTAPSRDWRTVLKDNRRLRDLDLEIAVNGASPELLELMAEQKADAKRERGVLAAYMVSLDAPAPWMERGETRTFYDRLDAAGNRHTTEWNRPTEDQALVNVGEWEVLRDVYKDAG